MNFFCNVFIRRIFHFWPFFRNPLPKLTFLLLMYQVMLAAGNEVPTVHVAFKLSLAISVFFSRIMRGSSFGSSMTCMVAMRMSVWNNGASSETSHWNWPVKSRVTPRSVTEVASECVNWELMRVSWQFAPFLHSASTHIYIDSRYWKRSGGRRLLGHETIKFFGLEIPSDGV